jgi:hypothetical protein
MARTWEWCCSCPKTHVGARHAILMPFGAKGRDQKFDNHRRDQFQFRHDRDGGFAASLIWRLRRHLTMHSDYVFSPNAPLPPLS